MFTIGDFARHGRVSVRMLRHYDAVGLLRPARIEPSSGYRSYEAAQLGRLNRIIALKELGFTLQQVGSILDEQTSAAELRGMLRLRRIELQARIAADADRLGQVETRLRIIESEGRMPTEDVVVKTIPAVRVAELTATAAGFEPDSITPVIQPLYGELMARLAAAEVIPTGSPIAYYDHRPDGSVLVHAGITVPATTAPGPGYAVVDLPEIATAATIVHRGSMDEVMPSVQALAQWVSANGYRSIGSSREFYLECPADRAAWVTELQEPVAAQA